MITPANEDTTMKTSASTVWKRSTVPNGPVQFYATIMVLQYLTEHYHNTAGHQRRVLAILAKRDLTS